MPFASELLGRADVAVVVIHEDTGLRREARAAPPPSGRSRGPAWPVPPRPTRSRCRRDRESRARAGAPADSDRRSREWRVRYAGAKPPSQQDVGADQLTGRHPGVVKPGAGATGPLSRATGARRSATRRSPRPPLDLLPGRRPVQRSRGGRDRGKPWRVFQAGRDVPPHVDQDAAEVEYDSADARDSRAGKVWSSACTTRYASPRRGRGQVEPRTTREPRDKAMPSKPPRPPQPREPRRRPRSRQRARAGSRPSPGRSGGDGRCRAPSQREPGGRGLWPSGWSRPSWSSSAAACLHPASRPGRRARGAGMGRDGRAPQPSSAGTSCRRGWPRGRGPWRSRRAVWTPDVLTDPAIVLSPDLRRAHRGHEGSGGPRRAAPRLVVLAIGAVIILAYPVGRVLPGGRDPAGRGLRGPDCAGARERPAVRPRHAGAWPGARRCWRWPGSSRSRVPSKEAMRRVAREVARALGADMSGVYFSTPSGQVLRPVAGYHVPTHLLSAFLETPLPLSAFDETVAERGPIWTSDYLADRRFDFPFMTAIEPGAVPCSLPPRSRGDGRGHLPRLVGLRPRLAHRRSVSSGAWRLRWACRRERGAGPADRREARRDGAAAEASAERCPRPSSSARSCGPSGHGSRGPPAPTRRGSGSPIPPAASSSRSRGYHVTPGAGRAAPALPDRSRPEPLYTQAIARRAVVTSPDAPNDEGLPPGLREPRSPPGPALRAHRRERALGQRESSWSGGSAS